MSVIQTTIPTVNSARNQDNDNSSLLWQKLLNRDTQVLNDSNARTSESPEKRKSNEIGAAETPNNLKTKRLQDIERLEKLIAKESHEILTMRGNQNTSSKVFSNKLNAYMYKE